METWRIVERFPAYEVSDLGNVRSVRGVRKTKRDPQNYVQVVLFNNGKSTSQRVHRLVAIAFLPNPEGLPQVNHIDFDKSNNASSNLEWCTSKHNENEKIEHLRKIGKYIRPHAKLSKEKIARAKVMQANGVTQKDIAAVFNVSRSAVGYALAGKTWKGEHL